MSLHLESHVQRQWVSIAFNDTVVTYFYISRLYIRIPTQERGNNEKKNGDKLFSCDSSKWEFRSIFSADKLTLISLRNIDTIE